jgi:hypothetical protein
MNLAEAKARRDAVVSQQVRQVSEFATTRPTPTRDENDALLSGNIVSESNGICRQSTAIRPLRASRLAGRFRRRLRSAQARRLSGRLTLLGPVLPAAPLRSKARPRK